MPRGPQARLLPVYLEPELYQRLDRTAKDNDREVTQQARHIIRLALQNDRPSPDPRDPGAAA